MSLTAYSEYPDNCTGTEAARTKWQLGEALVVPSLPGTVVRMEQDNTRQVPGVALSTLRCSGGYCPWCQLCWERLGAALLPLVSLKANHAKPWKQKQKRS